MSQRHQNFKTIIFAYLCTQINTFPYYETNFTVKFRDIGSFAD